MNGVPDPSGLTGREREVLRLLASCATASRIGRQLQISERTVHKHLQNVYGKLGVHDRLGAVLRGLDLGLLGPGPRPAGPGTAPRPDVRRRYQSRNGPEKVHEDAWAGPRQEPLAT